MRKNLRQYLSVATIVLLTTFVIPAVAQNGWGNDHGRNSRDSQTYRNDSRTYQQGYRDGLRDAQRRGSPSPNPRRWKNNDDRQSYSAGYQRGYRQGMAAMQRQNGRYRPYGSYGNYGRDRVWGRNGGYGAYPQGGVYSGNRGSELARVAQQSGYTDGAFYAQRDMQRGDRFNPTGAKGYKDADHNYSSSLGSKDEFKQIYREAFIRGYQAAYR